MLEVTPRMRIATPGFVVAIFLLLTLAAVPQALSESPKEARTGVFWQMDPTAAFEEEGSNYCAPTSISNGLVYLAKARGMTDLVTGTDHKSHIALIQALAEHMETDPEIGTPPSQIISGLHEYLQTRGYSFALVQLAGWRKIDSDHKQYLVSRTPELNWIRKSADDPDTIVILNNGWYRETEDGDYVRKGGHFTIAVAAGPGAGELQVHNPAMKPEAQKTDTSVTLEPLASDTVAGASSNGVDSLHLDGFYKMHGPGLPFTAKKAAFAALDFVIVFKVKK